MAFIWRNLNPLHPRLPWLNWPSGSGEKDENVKNLQTDVANRQRGKLTRATVPTWPNLTESRPKPYPGFAFGVRSGSARVDPEQTPTRLRPDAKQTQSGPRADAKRTSKANPNFRSKPVKRTRGPLFVTELSIRITDKLSWLIGALTNQKARRYDHSACQTIIQCKSVCFFQQHVWVELGFLLNNVLRKKPTIMTSRDYKISFLL